MTTAEAGHPADETGPIGPVAFSALAFLLVAAPLMRGGNRQVALIVLEAAALAFLAALVAGLHHWRPHITLRGALLAFLCLSPLWLAVVYLVPIPASLWAMLPGRASYLGYLQAAGIAEPAALALSLAPDATIVSLLAGLPIAAGFLAGLMATLPQLRAIFIVVAALAALQTVIALLQVAGGQDSALLMGAAAGRPVGTFANPNHFANYVAMGLVAYLWLAWLRTASRVDDLRDPHAARRRRMLWAGGTIFLLVGMVMSLSRGALLAALATAFTGLLLAGALRGHASRWRRWAAVSAGVAAGALMLVGTDAVLERFDRMSTDAPARTIQAETTMTGVREFWPFGAGWGSYGAVYPRFQPSTLVGTADYTHQDYAQMLFEGGIFALLLMAVAGGLLAQRAVRLARAEWRHGRLRRHELAAAVCGLGVLGFLLHSYVEFNMHIPANAILAALLAGAYLRPLPPSGTEEEARA